MIFFAVLAHDQPGCLQDQLDNLRTFVPDCRVVVFNGGRDLALTAGLDVPVCDTSRPLTHHRVGVFHGLVMQWLMERGEAFDHLVTLDSDMLLIKDGLPDHLTAVMQDASYMGAHFAEVLPDTPWRPGRRFHLKWAGHWQEIFDLDHPFRAFNPGQVFRRDYVEAFYAWPRRAALLDRVCRTRLDALDEIVWATLGRSLGLTCRPAPGGHALQLRRHAPRELESYVRDPDVFMVHRVGMNENATDRRLIRSLARREAVDWDVPVDYPVLGDAAAPWRKVAAAGKDVYQRWTPASRS